METLKLEVINQQYRTLRRVVFFFFSRPLTSEVKLLYGFSIGGMLVLEVGDGGVLEYKPIVFVRPQR